MVISFCKVTDSTGHVLYKKEDATKGKFAFTTDDYDMYKVCLESEGRRRNKLNAEQSQSFTC